MKQRYFVRLASGKWSEVNYKFYVEYDGEKKKSIFDITQ